jgi:hypothetical protein
MHPIFIKFQNVTLRLTLVIFSQTMSLLTA